MYYTLYISLYIYIYIYITKKETTKFDYKGFNLRRDIVRSEGNIEMYNIYTTKNIIQFKLTSV